LQAAAAQARQLLAWLNVVPVLLGAVLLWLLGGRLLLAAWCSAWLLWLLYQADALTIEHLHRHPSPADLHLLPQRVSNSPLFVRCLPWGGWVVAMLVPVLAATAALAWWEPRTLPRLRWRLLLLLPMLLLAATLLRGDGFWRAHYSDAALAGFHVWSPDRSIERSGLPAGLLRLGWESGVSTPAADPDLLRAFEHEHAAALAWRGSRSGPLWLPDIVVVQSEALFDPARLRGLDPADVLPHWRRLAANGVHGNLQVPAYGGGTIRTEFEVLTGVPLSAFPQVAYPYFGLAMRPLPSLPRALAALGYRTTVLHPFRRAFWNRDTALRRLGVAESVFEGDALLRGAARSGYYTSDKAL